MINTVRITTLMITACLAPQLISVALSQSLITKTIVRDHIGNNVNTYQVFTIDTLEIAVNDGKFEKALKQHGIIGNDFYKDIEIGKASNNNIETIIGPISTFTPTNYYPVDGFKRTFCGKALENEFYDGSVDNDLNLRIAVNPDNELLTEYSKQLKSRSRNLNPYSFIEGEIDITSDSHAFYDPSNTRYSLPAINTTDVCLYGPWVEELYNSGEDMEFWKDHEDSHEIHPAEQFWWAINNQNGSSFYLCSAQDESGRFNDGLLNYDEDPKQFWVTDTMVSNFALAFEVRVHSPTQIYTIQTINRKNTKAAVDDGKTHYLVYKKDTILKVREPEGMEFLNIGFENVGLDPYSMLQSTPDSVIRGFIMVRSILFDSIYYSNGMPGGMASNSKLKITRWSPRRAQVNFATLSKDQSQSKNSKGRSLDAVDTSQIVRKIKIELKQITCTENKFYHMFAIPGQTQPTELHFPNVKGYITVHLSDIPGQVHPDSKNLESMFEDRDVLLFPTNDPSSLKNNAVLQLHEGESKNYDSTYEIVNVKATEALEIRTDFVASFQDDFIRTLELNEYPTYFTSKLDVSSLVTEQPLEWIITLTNQKNNGEDPKFYSLQIKLSAELLQ